MFPVGNISSEFCSTRSSSLWKSWLFFFLNNVPEIIVCVSNWGIEALLNRGMIVDSWKCNRVPFLHTFVYLSRASCYLLYKTIFCNNNIDICKTHIDVQPLIDVQSSNPCPISTSQTSVPQIYVLFSNSQIGIQFSNLCPF